MPVQYENRQNVSAALDVLIRFDGAWKLLVVPRGGDDALQTIELVDTDDAAIDDVLDVLVDVIGEMTPEAATPEAATPEAATPPSATTSDAPTSDATETVETPSPVVRVRPERAVKASEKARKVLATLDTADGSLDKGELATDPYTKGARTALNVAAAWTASETVEVSRDRAGFLRIVRNDATDEDRRMMSYYSGLGGLSAVEHEAQFPPDFPVPDARGLLDEFYTPRRVASEVAKAMRTLLLATPVEGHHFAVLEPSAGIGRFREALDGDDFRWTLVELSKTSATMLKARFPGDQVYQGAFEKWVSQVEAGTRFEAVISNPPYPAKRAYATDDPDRSYRESRAYLYFLRRGLDLLRRRGVGAFVIPAGFMSGKGAEMRAARETVLRRHHLIAAFRLPSDIFPGALIVVDVVFFRSRGGDLGRVPESDAAVLAGDYFKSVAPSHLLGVERGELDDAAETDRSDPKATPKGKRPRVRFNYQVEGEFKGFPTFVERVLLDEDLAAAEVAEDPKGKPKKKKGSGVRTSLEVRTEGLPEHLARAVMLGARYDRYAERLAIGETDEHVRIWPELHDGLETWVKLHGNPWQDIELRNLAENGDAAAGRFLQAFEGNGSLTPSVAERPVFRPKFPGDPNDLGGLADFFYRAEGALTVDALIDHDAKVRGVPREVASARVRGVLPQLLATGWCLDANEGTAFEQLMPAKQYLSGFLWPRHDRAVELLAKGAFPLYGTVERSAIEAQRVALMREIAPMAFEDIETSPRSGWIPETLLAEWIRDEYYKADPVLPLVRTNGLMSLEGGVYDTLNLVLGYYAGLVVGYVNHDLKLFKPEKPSKDDDIEAIRLQFAQEFETKFRAWLSALEDRRAVIEETYNRHFRGWKPAEYSAEPVQVIRWTTNARFVPAPHQWRAAHRIVSLGRGLLAFDVGVGKTFTALLVIALMKQLGQARRPVVVVPNPIVFQWVRECARVLPDFRVVVIGANSRTISRGPRKGMTISEPDGAEDQGRKWAKFQAGEYDLAILAYSALSRTELAEEGVLAYAKRTAAIRRDIQLQQRRLRSMEERANKKVRDLTEREKAILNEGVVGWVKGLLEARPGEPFVPGIVFDDIGIDFMAVDEAQNFKNLYLPEEREGGGVPKFMGAAGEGADRAWQLDFRLEAVRRKNRGAGVLLLSGTPAKNSPLELYNMIQYVDHEAWSRLGIRDPESFTSRYLHIERKQTVGTNLEVKELPCVVGFKNLHELRDTLFRYSEFKTAEEANLKLPRPVVQFVDASGGAFTSAKEGNATIYRDSAGNVVDIIEVGIPMDAAQELKYIDYVAEVEAALKAGKRTEGEQAGRILGLLMRLALVALHSKLDEGRDWYTADTIPDPASPKFIALARRIVARLTCGQVVLCAEGSEEAVARRLVDLGTPLDRVLAWKGRDKAQLDAFAHGRVRRDGEYEVVVMAAERFEKSGLGSKACGVHTVSDAKSIDAIAEHVLVARTCGHIVFCDNLAAHKLMRRVMIDAGIPAERIGVLNAVVAKSGEERAQIAAEFNGDPETWAAPKYDVVICNQIAYEGVNLQRRTCAIHHLDLPWEPATLQQRNGRGVRQGNIRSAIEINYYFSKRSMDGLRFSMIQGKRGWMVALLASQDRATNNPGAELSLTAEDILLLISRNPEQTRQRIEEKRARDEEERLKKIGEEAVRMVNRANGCFRKAERADDPVLAAQARAEGEQWLAKLVDVEVKAWPWAAWAAPARFTNTSAYSADYPPLSEGLRFAFNDSMEGRRYYEVGRIDASWGMRKAGSATWITNDSNGMLWQHYGFVSEASDAPSTAVVDPIDWPTDDDTRTDADVRRMLSQRLSDGWTKLGWTVASETFLARVWGQHEAEVREFLAGDPVKRFEATVPVEEGGALKLLAPVDFGSHPTARLLPPTREGWDRYNALAREVDDRQLSHTTALDAGRWWWGRTLRTGVVGSVRKAAEAAAKAAKVAAEAAAAAVPAPPQEPPPATPPSES